MMPTRQETEFLLAASSPEIPPEQDVRALQAKIAELSTTVAEQAAAADHLKNHIADLNSLDLHTYSESEHIQETIQAPIKTILTESEHDQEGYLPDFYGAGVDDDHLAYLDDSPSVGSASPVDLMERCIDLKVVSPLSILETAVRSTTTATSLITYINKNNDNNAYKALAFAITNSDPDLIPAIDRYIDVIRRGDSPELPHIIVAFALSKALSSITTPTSDSFGDQVAMLTNDVIAAYTKCKNAAHILKLIEEDALPFAMIDPTNLVLNRLDPKSNPTKYNNAGSTLIALLKAAMNRLQCKHASSDAVIAMWKYKGKSFDATSLPYIRAHEQKNWHRVVNKIPSHPPEYDRALNLIHGFELKIRKEISSLLSKRCIDSYSLTMDMAFTLARISIDKLSASTSFANKIMLCEPCMDPPDPPALPPIKADSYALAATRQPAPINPSAATEEISAPCPIHPDMGHMLKDCHAIHYELGSCLQWLKGACTRPSCDYAHSFADMTSMSPSAGTLLAAINKAKASLKDRNTIRADAAKISLAIVKDCSSPPVKEKGSSIPFNLSTSRPAGLSLVRYKYNPPKYCEPDLDFSAFDE